MPHHSYGPVVRICNPNQRNEEESTFLIMLTRRHVSFKFYFRSFLRQDDIPPLLGFSPNNNDSALRQILLPDIHPSVLQYRIMPGVILTKEGSG
ncbi:MAG TPA: hypothetical protein VNW99_12955 [Cytophagaceae bacterium]|jgi:hypothetical protein|nr:hypothetical protein [Cytophagaceae bacterium]